MRVGASSENRSIDPIDRSRALIDRSIDQSADRSRSTAAPRRWRCSHSERASRTEAKSHRRHALGGGTDSPTSRRWWRLGRRKRLCERSIDPPLSHRHKNLENRSTGGCLTDLPRHGRPLPRDRPTRPLSELRRSTFYLLVDPPTEIAWGA